jgi:hypothetical protein
VGGSWRPEEVLPQLVKLQRKELLASSGAALPSESIKPRTVPCFRSVHHLPLLRPAMVARGEGAEVLCQLGKLGGSR